MKNQYVGDVNDYHKYGLLRILSNFGKLRVAVCWMLTPSDGRTDGSKTRYLQSSGAFRHHDPDLFDGLRRIIQGSNARHVDLVEKSALLPGARFYSDIVPDETEPRTKWFDQIRREADQYDLIFFDPDNGLEIKSRPAGSRESSKHILWEEVAALSESRAAILIYQHFPREERTPYIERRAKELHDLTGRRVASFKTGNVVFFLLQPPKGKCHFTRSAPILRRHWGARFESTDHSAML